MINYLQLGRGLRRFTPKVEAKTSTYVYNAKGIYDFKQMSPEINEALTRSFDGIENPFLEITVTRSKHPVGVIRIKDGNEEVSMDTFVLNEGENIENYLPKTDGCIKKLLFDRKGIAELGKKYKLLGTYLQELTANMQKPTLEFWIKDKSRFSIGSMTLSDTGERIVNGYFSKTKDTKTPIEKFHFTNRDERVSGYGKARDMHRKKINLLPQKWLKRLWILDERAKDIIKRRYGIGCSPQDSDTIAKFWNLTGARIRGIIKHSRAVMENTDSYVHDLGADLDNLGEYLSEQERYQILKKKSSFDINQAKYKIIIQDMKKGIIRKEI